MKVTVNGKEQKEITYPCLMEYKDSDLIVLFYTKLKGIVLIGNISYKKGDYSDTWNMRAFQPFHGTITLQND